MGYRRNKGSEFDRDYYLLAERDNLYEDSITGYYRRKKRRFLIKIFVFLLAILFIGVCYLAFVFNYKSPYIFDPIEKIRAQFIDIQFCAFAFSSIILMILNTQRKISKKLLPLFIGIFICLLSIVGITINKYNDFKLKYNETTFQKMFSYDYMKNMNITNYSKELFVNECCKIDAHFKIKVITIGAGQYILVMISGAFCVLEILHRKQYKRLEHENKILFDEEENIKV